MAENILVVDDEREIADLVEVYYVRESGHTLRNLVSTLMIIQYIS